MANQQHIEWLLEGVEAWNARREREGFVPDFEGADIRAAFEEAGKLDKLDRVPLERAKLKGAGLRGAALDGAVLVRADLRWADLGRGVLEGADLRWADLRWADLGRADLRLAELEGSELEGSDLGGTDLRWAVLEGANLSGAKLDRADVRTLKSPLATKTSASGDFTDLSQTIGLTQDQLDVMLGDSETRIPDGLIRPKHWPKFDPDAEKFDQLGRHPTLEAEPVSFNLDAGDAELKRIQQARTKLASVTPIADVEWTETGHLKAELRPVQPAPRQSVPAPNPEAVFEQLRGVLALSKQLRQQIENSTSPNAAPFIGDAGKIFIALETELAKDQRELIPVVVKANVAALKAMGASAEALAATEEALYTIFIEEADKLLHMLPVLKIIENPYNEDIVPDQAVAPALDALHDLDEIANTPEVIGQLGPRLGGVTRDAEGFPWESDKQKIANKTSFWLQVRDKLKNPPDSVKGAALYIAVANALLVIIEKLLSLL